MEYCQEIEQMKLPIRVLHHCMKNDRYQLGDLGDLSDSYRTLLSGGMFSVLDSQPQRIDGGVAGCKFTQMSSIEVCWLDSPSKCHFSCDRLLSVARAGSVG